MASNLRSSSSPRKVRFPPKPPPRREVKPPQTRREAVQEGDADDDEKRALLKAVAKHLRRGQPKAEKKLLHSTSAEIVDPHGVEPSTSVRTYGTQQADEISNDKGLKGSVSSSDDDLELFSLPPANTTDGILETNKDPLFKKKKKEYKEPWDYNSNYPTTLPWRRPFSGDPELLNEAEFGEANSAVEYDESTVNSASELGLLEKVNDEKLLIFQLPANVPLGEQPTRTDRMDTGSGTPGGTVPPIGGNASKKIPTLRDLTAGYMGKLLVYKSGTVKLKLGDILFDVSPGVDCAFAQEVVTVDTNEKVCCAIGEPNNKWAVVTPDIDSLL